MDLTFGKKYFEDSMKNSNYMNSIYSVMKIQNNKMGFKLYCHLRKMQTRVRII